MTKTKDVEVARVETNGDSESSRTASQHEAMALVCLDLHEALGVPWGHDPYQRIAELKAAVRVPEPPSDWFNQVCAALGLFDGARPVSPATVLWDEVLPTIEALKTNNPEAGVLVREQQRVDRLWREALARLVDANRRADGFLKRWHKSEADRELLRSALKAAAPLVAPAGVPEPPITSGTALITAERQRQIDREGWTAAHDDTHAQGEMLVAAICYAAHVGQRLRLGVKGAIATPRAWPWHVSWWKPSVRPIRNLVKAGALIAAEIDRLQRAEQQRPTP